MGRFLLSRIVMVSAKRFYSRYSRCPSKGFSNLHSHSLSTLQSLLGYGHTPNPIGATHRYRDCLSLPVLYLNSHVFKYTTSSNSKKNGTETNRHLLQNGLTSRPLAFRLGIVPTALLVLISAGLLLHYNDERRAIPKASQQGSANITSKPSIGGPFTLTDCDGKPITDREFLGHWTLIYFGYTSSPDTDPEELQKMAKVIDILELKNIRINPVFITIDPLRDTPSQLRAYLKEFHAKIMGLTGPVNAVRQVAQLYRVYFKKTDEEGSDYLIDCSHNMYLKDPNMEFVRMFGLECNAEQLTDAIAYEVKKYSKLD